jgi:hypothetical protein
MSEHLRRELGNVATEAVPNCVDRARFGARGDPVRRYLTYQGTGAPWQGLEILSRVWGELARADPGLVFRVISNDARTRVLGAHLPEARIEYRSGDGPADVAALLHECRAGFIIRSPHVANRVSFPTKFGEYVAAGVPVVCSDVGWELTGIVRTTGCGVSVPADASVVEVAARTVDLLGDPVAERAAAAGCAAAALLLDRDTWIERLAARLPAA